MNMNQKKQIICECVGSGLHSCVWQGESRGGGHGASEKVATQVAGEMTELWGLGFSTSS